MFDGKRYVAKRVSETIPTYLQNILWYIIEIMDVPNVDYFQTFKLEIINDNEKANQRITHSQAWPEYTKEHIIKVNEVISNKIYVIDDGDHSTMLLAEEY